MAKKTLLLCWLAAAPLLPAHPEHSGQHAAESVAEQAPSLGSVTMEIVNTDYLVITSKDLPGHETGNFPSRGNPHTISAQSLAFRVPLNPRRAEKPMSYDGYEFGVAINGVPFDPGTGEFWRGNRQWRQEAILHNGKTQLGIDQSNAHVQPTGKYHYHGIPWGLINELRKEKPKAGVDEPVLLGWAADGFPIYYQEGVRSSWQLKKGEREGEPTGPGGSYNGQYTVDYEYVADSGDLDWLNGRYGATDEYPEGIYQYYVTEAFPFAPRYFYGVPDESFSKRQHGQANMRGGPGGMRPGGFPGGGRPGGGQMPLPPDMRN